MKGETKKAREFVIWKELADGKEMVCSWELCDVYLVNDSGYPGWLVLVPRIPGAREIFQLSAEDQVRCETNCFSPASVCSPSAVNHHIFVVGLMCSDVDDASSVCSVTPKSKLLHGLSFYPLSRSVSQMKQCREGGSVKTCLPVLIVTR